MTLRATQTIASAFGTYRPGDEVSPEAAGPVLEAWLAAGIVAEEPNGETAVVEAATRSAPERAVGRRLGTVRPPQRRFAAASAKDDAP